MPFSTRSNLLFGEMSIQPTNTSYIEEDGFTGKPTGSQ